MFKCILSGASQAGLNPNFNPYQHCNLSKFTTSGFQSYSYSSLTTSPSPFKDNGLPSWVPNVLCQHSVVVLWVAQCSNVLSMNLWGRKWSPHPIPPSS